jgi:hypothetical protein
LENWKLNISKTTNRKLYRISKTCNKLRRRFSTTKQKTVSFGVSKTLLGYSTKGLGFWSVQNLTRDVLYHYAKSGRNRCNCVEMYKEQIRKQTQAHIHNIYYMGLLNNQFKTKSQIKTKEMQNAECLKSWRVFPYIEIKLTRTANVRSYTPRSKQRNIKAGDVTAGRTGRLHNYSLTRSLYWKCSDLPYVKP